MQGGSGIPKGAAGTRRADLAGADGKRSERSAERDRRAPAGSTPAAFRPGYCTGQADTGGASLHRTGATSRERKEEAGRVPDGRSRRQERPARDVPLGSIIFISF